MADAAAVAVEHEEEDAVGDVEQAGAQPARGALVGDREARGEREGARLAPAPTSVAIRSRVVGVHLGTPARGGRAAGSGRPRTNGLLDGRGRLHEGELAVHRGGVGLGRARGRPSRASAARRRAGRRPSRRRPPRPCRSGAIRCFCGAHRVGERVGDAEAAHDARARRSRPAPRRRRCRSPPTIVCSSTRDDGAGARSAAATASASSGLTVPKWSTRRVDAARREHVGGARAPRGASCRSTRASRRRRCAARSRGRARTVRRRQERAARRSCRAAGRPGRRCASAARAAWPASAGSPGVSTRHARQRAHQRDVLDRVVRRAEVAVGDAGADADELHVGARAGDVDADLVVRRARRGTARSSRRTAPCRRRRGRRRRRPSSASTTPTFR